jgi:hypothetical protein
MDLLLLQADTLFMMLRLGEAVRNFNRLNQGTRWLISCQYRQPTIQAQVWRRCNKKVGAKWSKVATSLMTSGRLRLHKCCHRLTLRHDERTKTSDCFKRADGFDVCSSVRTLTNTHWTLADCRQVDFDIMLKARSCAVSVWYTRSSITRSMILLS